MNASKHVRFNLKLTRKTARGIAVCPSSLAHLDVCFGNNPHHALDGLEDFSHVWLVFLFDKNGTNYTPKAHVAPPRLKGDGAPSSSK